MESERIIPPGGFDRWAPRYDRSPLQLIFFSRVHHAVLVAADGGAIAADGAQPRDLLDVGCGTGQLLERLASRFPQASLSGVDAAREMASRAAARLADASIHFATAEVLPFPDESFDLATSTISFHHWDDQEAGLREVRRVLRGTGRFILADLADLPWWLAWHRNDGNFVPHGERTAMLERAGFRELESYRIYLRAVRLSVCACA